VYLLLIEKEQIFLLRRYNTGYEDGKYSLPAGHLEEGESAAEGLLREVREEIGLELDPETIDLVHVMHRREDDIRVDLFFTGSSREGEPHNAEPEKCDEAGWFPLDGLPDTTISYIREAIQAWQGNIIYSERGFDD
jgi:ADP-ribose pyrophosphatase YjhB (NUDIX family)